MKYLITYILTSLVFLSASFAQNEFDVLRYSTQDFYGEARFNAMGGSFGALGANMSALSINPGGLGFIKVQIFHLRPHFIIIIQKVIWMEIMFLMGN
ncbi:MAG: hypothetical protein JKY30_14980 [Flavobacteriales bacterium]|nr:hypothetical protein [Flavobacteriales bacterium]